LARFTHHAGELRYKVSGANTIVSGDVNGDGKADFSIVLKGHILLHFPRWARPEKIRAAGTQWSSMASVRIY
jgi:hypothetical protein